MSWRVGLVVRSTCSCKGPQFDSKSLHGGYHFLGIRHVFIAQMYMQSKHSYTQNKKINLKKMEHKILFHCLILYRFFRKSVLIPFSHSNHFDCDYNKLTMTPSPELAVPNSSLLTDSFTLSNSSKILDCENLILLGLQVSCTKPSFVIFFLTKNYKITIIFSQCIQNTLLENLLKFQKLYKNLNYNATVFCVCHYLSQALSLPWQHTLYFTLYLKVIYAEP